MTFKPARRIRWKNLRCPTCGIWVDRERLVEHARSPLHTRAAKDRR